MDDERSRLCLGEEALSKAGSFVHTQKPVGLARLEQMCLNSRITTHVISYRRIEMQKITPFLWFDNQAEEAANFYISIFKNSAIKEVVRYGEAGPGPAGSAMTVSFELEGQAFTALNGGPIFKFTEAISFYVNCQSQAEVDELWARLTEGGEEGQCGWLKDKFGLSWQIVPNRLIELLGDPDPAKANRVMEAMLQMQKIDVPTLEQAYAQA
jgi:predicted 3-demethylubiquinone-9 3-methyltransferase (glyoxalase superfamily)